MKVIITQRAKQNLLNLFDYNVNISLDYAIRIDKKIRSYIEGLQYTPYIGRYITEITGKRYRERICEKFRIIYLVSEKENIIFIMYVFSVRQDKKTFFEIHKNEILSFLNLF